jgi:AraC-like DNA-binding protein
MTYLVYTPSPPLSMYIKRLYYVNAPFPYLREKILPMPLVELKVNIAGAYQVYQADNAQPFATCAESWVVGLMSTYHIADRPNEARRIGVTFKLGGAYPFLRTPLSELCGQFVPLDAIWGSLATEIHEQLCAAPSIQARFELLERLLLERLAEAPCGLRAIRYAVEQIAAQHGALSIRTLSDHMGMSQKHLIAQFNQMVGGTPKLVARLYRFAHLVSSIDPIQPIDWTRVAHDYLFYDQSHFSHEFAAFTGHNPTEYLRLRRRMCTESPENTPYLHRLPTG